MPCSALHLAIVESYVNKNKVNKNIFIKGAILPDLASDKNLSHYGINKKIETVKDLVETKVDIVKCSLEFDFSDELNKAIYLHLLTDYLFYKYIYNPETEKESKKSVLESLDNDQNLITDYILSNYKIDKPDEAYDLLKNRKSEGRLRFISRENVDRFISVIANLNLDEVRQKIIKNKDLFFEEFLKKMNNSL